MSDFEPELFEKQLTELQPAKAPDELIRHMVNRASMPQPEHVALGILRRFGCWRHWLRWAAGATIAIGMVIAFLGYRPTRTLVHNQTQPAVNSAKTLLKVDNVELDRRLVASFDAVAQLPSGEPVRLHCRQWLDAVVLRDTTRGVVIERQSPRLEVVPVRFETY